LHSAQGPHSSVQKSGLPNAIGTELQLAELQIAVLHQLNNLSADTGEPIEVIRTPDGHIRVSGTILDSSLKQEIVSHLERLGDHQLLDLRLISPRDVHAQISGSQHANPEDTNVYDVDQARPGVDATLRKYFQAKGLSGERLDFAIKQYSHDALQHAQHALQHAYALDRLGSALSATELKSISLSSQEQWMGMVHKHATYLEEQLRALHTQLAEISPQAEESSDAGQLIQIEDPARFNQATSQLLHRTQDLNGDVGSLFTSNVLKAEQSDALLATTVKTIPLGQAEEITRFAVKLKTSARSALVKPQNDGDNKGIVEQPR
jgi:hypothetical protein